jgi:hypothetical protein
VIRRSLAVLPLALAIGLIGSGCGSDGSGETTTAPTVSIPAITSPVPTTASSSVTASVPTSTATTNGGKGFNPAEPDSETNDIPPAKGSPEEAFEKQCRQQGTCG